MEGFYIAIGIGWIGLTSTLATFAIFYLAFIGLRVIVRTGTVVVKETADAPELGAAVAREA